MVLIFESACLESFGVLIAGIICLLTYYQWAFKYWERKNVPYIKPTFPFGTMSSPFGKPEAFGTQSKRRYDELKSNGHKHGGLFALSTPTYMPVDLEYIKNIMSKDFNYFVDRGVYHNEKDDPISAHLFSIEGAKWRNLRMKLTPTFTSGKMKMMFQTLNECGNQLKTAMDNICDQKDPVDIKDVLGRFTTDVIGSCAFGLDCNSFKDPNSKFRRYSQRVFISTKLEALKGFFAFSFPNLARFLRFCLTPKESAEFFMDVTKQTVEYREKSNIVRKDFMQLLIDIKNNAKNSNIDDHSFSQHDGKTLTIEEVAAQAFIFFLAGFETSSTTMTFCLFELAQNEAVQEKAREEVNTILDKYNGQLTYDAIMDMKYMGQIIDETLRKFPPVPVLNRKCVESYKIPGTNVIIEKGTPVLISSLGLHHDPEYFPDPEKFDPERFNETNKSKIRPFTYMPFGEGPRICIGLRFGVMQTKVGLAILLKNYKFSLNSKTQLPLKMNPFSFILSPLGDIWLSVTKV